MSTLGIREVSKVETTVDDYRKLQKACSDLKQRIKIIEIENMRLKKENVLTIVKKTEKIVHPPGYQRDMERLKELEKRNKVLEKIIEYGNISTVTNIIKEFKSLSVNHLERLSRELQFYSMCQEEHDELVAFIEYLVSIQEELSKFVFTQLERK